MDSVRVIAVKEMQKQPSSSEIGVGVGGQEQGDRSSEDELESANNTMITSIPKPSLSKQKQEESVLFVESSTKRGVNGVQDTDDLESIPDLELIPNIDTIPDKETEVAPEIEQWNAADYLFVSTRLAKMYPEVPESKMVRNMDVVHR